MSPAGLQESLAGLDRSESDHGRHSHHRALSRVVLKRLPPAAARGGTPADYGSGRRTCEFSRGTVGSAGTCQPAAAARRSQARRRARPAYDAGVHLRPGPGPANRPSAARIRGRRTMAEEVGVRQPDDGQAAADDARPRPLHGGGRKLKNMP
eukprot:scaffold7820_cov51-Phaeocystis_antarctica.AAC.2